MDTALVSARMSRAKKERAGSILESIGATASDLINSAYDYVVTRDRKGLDRSLVPIISPADLLRQTSEEGGVTYGAVEIEPVQP